MPRARKAAEQLGGVTRLDIAISSLATSRLQGGDNRGQGKETRRPPRELESIAYKCFRCSAVKTIVISKSLKNISENAFSRCDNLKIVLPEGLASIGEEWFSGSGIGEISVPTSVQAIGNQDF